jgi:hypothetical protein
MKTSSLKLDIGPRPICKVCNTRERTIANKRKDGSYNFQSMCTPCKHAHLEKKNGVKYTVQCAQNAGCNSVKENKDRIARENGFSSHKEYTKHLNHQLALENGFTNYLDYSKHLNHQLALENGFKNYLDYAKHLNHQLALENGFKNYLDYTNSKHPYRKHRKDYCENIDGRLGIPCTTTISILAQLDVDHIDGNARNNKLENLQTLCKCCHTYKTLKEKDYSTPGRKTLGIKY